MRQSLELPTCEEKEAWLLRTRQALDDRAVARVLGVTRETANRRINRFERKLAALRRACVGGNCTLLEAVLN
jgi:DNA-directed RNA polymerase specialized sigma24 family protein